MKFYNSKRVRVQSFKYDKHGNFLSCKLYLNCTNDELNKFVVGKELIPFESIYENNKLLGINYHISFNKDTYFYCTEFLYLKTLKINVDNKIECRYYYPYKDGKRTIIHDEEKISRILDYLGIDYDRDVFMNVYGIGISNSGHIKIYIKPDSKKTGVIMDVKNIDLSKICLLSYSFLNKKLVYYNIYIKG